MTCRGIGFTVRHHYRYEYTAPVSDVQQRLIMVPPDRHGDQVLTAFGLEVRGATGQTATAWHTDVFGNRVYRVDAERVDHAVDFEAWFAVRREAPAAARVATAEQERWSHVSRLHGADHAGRSRSRRGARDRQCRPLVRRAVATGLRLGRPGDRLPAGRDRHADAGRHGAPPWPRRVPGLRAHPSVRAALASDRGPLRVGSSAGRRRAARVGGGAGGGPRARHARRRRQRSDTPVRRRSRLHRRRGRSRLRGRHVDLRRVHGWCHWHAALEQAGVAF